MTASRYSRSASHARVATLKWVTHASTPISNAATALICFIHGVAASSSASAARADGQPSIAHSRLPARCTLRCHSVRERYVRACERFFDIESSDDVAFTKHRNADE